jgi:chemotaxis protein MotA
MQASQIGVLSQKKGKFTSIRSLVRTLIDYVQMLDDLNVPKTIKPSMAVAFLKTFYGTALTDILFLPLSHKLEGKSKEEVTVNCIHNYGLGIYWHKQNPSRLRNATKQYYSATPKSLVF